VVLVVTLGSPSVTVSPPAMNWPFAEIAEGLYRMILFRADACLDQQAAEGHRAAGRGPAKGETLLGAVVVFTQDDRAVGADPNRRTRADQAAAI